MPGLLGIFTPGAIRSRVGEEPTSNLGVSNRAGQLGTASQKTKQVEIAIDQGFFLRSTPAFDLMLSSPGFFASGEFLTPNKFNRKSCPGPGASFAVLVFGDSFLQFVCTPSIVRAISAEKHVCKEGFFHRGS